jgi:hypothetical protein
MQGGGTTSEGEDAKPRSSGSRMQATSQKSSVADLFRTQAATWFVGVVISVLAIFSSKITEYVKVALNSADFRSKYYEELAVNLSEFNFDAELAVEFLDNNWTTTEALTPVIKEYNDSITNLRKKEYVYLSWIGRYWGKSKMNELSATYDAVKAIDTAFHSLNDEFEAVNITKSKPTMDRERTKQALTRLHPALQKLQESSKTLLTDLQ